MKQLESLKKLDGKVLENVSLKNYTTYKVGGICRYLFFPKTIEALISALKLCRKEKVKHMVLGSGSNVLFSDRLYEGVIIKLDSFKNIELVGNKIKVGAGYPLMKLSLFAAKKSLTGLEFAGGIPGTVGGAVYMNAGAYKSDMGYIVKEVKVLTKDYEVITLVNRECQFHYRSSIFQTRKEDIILEVTLSLKKGNKKAIEEVMKDRKERRIATQPLEYPSAGSVFRNPEGMFVGKMIEDLGLKGLTKGGAQISMKHANFIINIGNAKSRDIVDLITTIRDAVYENYQVELRVEQELVNWEK